MGERKPLKNLKMDANHIVEYHLGTALESIGDYFNADVFMLLGPIRYGVDDALRKLIEKKDSASRKSRLLVILETTGGIVDVAQRIAETFRYHYPDDVQFLIPNFAFSAGTVLAMSGNDILMDYYSVLGPIDPQIENKSRTGLVPATGYLIQYERLIKKAADPNQKLTSAELHYFIEHFDPAELYYYEQARNLSISLLKEWLVNYKFKYWKKTSSRGKQVSKRMKTQRAASIARKLSDTDKWLSHGRGISKDVLINDLKLEITDFGADQEFDNRIKLYYNTLKDYMIKMGVASLIHFDGNLVPLSPI